MSDPALTQEAPSSAARGRRVPARARGWGPAYWILAALVVVGIAIRIVAFVGWWPVSTTLADAIPYSVYAEADPLGDPQHPVGYPALLALIGAFSRSVVVTIVIQHLLGIASAILLFAAVRRLIGSPWPALVPAAVVLLNVDLIFLEHTIMSEGPFGAAMSAAVYASVRAIDSPEPWWRWPAAAGALIVLAGLIRSGALFFLPIAVLAVLLARPRAWRPHWRAPVSVAGVGAILLLGYAFANLSANGRFEVGPTQGWHLYGRVAPFADCGQFTPPSGTKRLCEEVPIHLRPGGDFYLYTPDSPAQQAWGAQPWRRHDSDMGAWARQVILHQPKTYALTMWRDLRTYFVPSTRQPRPWSGGDLDAELDWTVWYDGSAKTVSDIRSGMRSFFDDFKPARDAGALELLHDYQRVFRFGATALTITTLLTLLGLLLGPRRNRISVLLLGGGGLAMLIGPVSSVYAIGRYSVPVAPLLAAGGAISAYTLWHMEAARRRS